MGDGLHWNGVFSTSTLFGSALSSVVYGVLWLVFRNLLLVASFSSLPTYYLVGRPILETMMMRGLVASLLHCFFLGPFWAVSSLFQRDRLIRWASRNERGVLLDVLIIEEHRWHRRALDMYLVIDFCRSNKELDTNH